MAAVFGILGRGSEQDVRGMGAMLAHRGAAEQVAGVGPELCVGLRQDAPRVAMVSRAGRTVLVHGAPVVKGGCAAATPSASAEEVLALTADAGPDGLSQMGGEFAVVLWNQAAGELTLATDYLATRPLHYTITAQGSFAFASEYKSFLALPEFRAEADKDMIQHLQHCKLLPTDRTLLKGVFAVPPGCAMTFGAGGRLVRTAMMPVIGLEVRDRSVDACAEDILKSFDETLSAQIGGRRSIGIALSGGIDSMAVACACRRLNPDAEIHTFTASHGEDDPERVRAEIVARHIRSIHHSVATPPSLMQAGLPPLVWHMENPIARTETLQLMAVGQVAREHVDCILTGVASDGLFAGMPKHKILWMARHCPPARHSLEEFYVLTQTGVRPRSLGGKALEALYFKGRLPAVPVIRGCGYRLPESLFPDMGPEYINRVLQAGFQRAVAAWLPKFERVFAASGIEVMSPFLDARMIRTAFGIPDRFKIWRGKEKFILRRALRSTLPAELLNTPKAPQRMRHDREFAGVLDDVAGRYLSPARVDARGWFDPADIAAIQASRRNGVYMFEAAMRLWTAVLTEVWADCFLDRAGFP